MVNRLTRDRAAAKPERPQRSTRFIYKERTADQIKRRADSAGGRFDSIFKSGFDSYRPKAGENAVRVLPPTWDDHEHFGYDIWVHKYVGPDESMYLCRMKMLNKACAWCDAAREAKDAGDIDESKKLSAKGDVIYWVIDRDDETPHPQLWHVSGMADGEISDLGRSKRTGKTYYLDHPDQGWDILVDKKGAKLRTRYTYKRDADAGPVPISPKSKKQEEILQFIMENPLPSVLKFYDNSYLEKLVAGGVHEQDQDLDGDDEPRRGKPRKGKKKDEDEEIDEDAEGAEDAETEEEDGDPDERPRGRSRRASRDDGDDNGDEAYHEGEADEDGEGEDGEEDGEPEQPRRGRGGARRPRDEDDEGDEGDDTESNEESEEDPDEKPRGRRTTSKPSRRSRREEDEEDNGEEGEEAGEEDTGEEDEGETRTTRTSSRRGTTRRTEAKPERRRVASRRTGSRR